MPLEPPCPLSPRAYTNSPVSVLRDEYTPLAQRALHHLFPGYPLGGLRITPKVIWHMVKAAAKRAGINDLAPHDLRRTCARLCHLAGGELEQIQFLLGHASVQTTERYLGCKQKLSQAVNDNLGLEDP